MVGEMTGLQYEIREVRWEDAEQVISNYYSLLDEMDINPWLGITTPPQRPSLPSEFKWFADLYSSMLEGDAVAYVAEADKRIVGMCEVRRRSKRIELSHIGNLGMYVSRNYRGKGVGKALLLKTIEGCRGRFEVITLEVFSNNLAAKKLYEKVGFKTYGVLPGGVKRGGNSVNLELMFLRLER